MTVLLAQTDGIEVYTTSVTGFINKCIDDVVPTGTVRTYPNQKPWITDNIRSLAALPFSSVLTCLHIGCGEHDHAFVGCAESGICHTLKAYRFATVQTCKTCRPLNRL